MPRTFWPTGPAGTRGIVSTVKVKPYGKEPDLLATPGPAAQSMTSCHADPPAGDRPGQPTRARVAETARALEQWGAARGWQGTDPYDGLNATRLVTPLRRGVLGRRVITQAVKRSPLDLRPLLGIPPGHSAAALAHVVAAYARGGFLAPEEQEARLSAAVAQLDAERSSAFEEAAWGYHFPVQTRVLFYPRGAPNTIATAFAGLALLDAHEQSGDERLLRTAVQAGEFFLRHVPQTEAAPGAYFGYLLGDRTPIHNANMLVCALLARLAARTGGQRFTDAAQAGVVYTVTRQRPDGSWPYGEEPHLAWVDNFHTGYVLEALMTCEQAGLGGELGGAIDRGLAFARRELFLAEGTPKYTPSSTFPVDAQCVAQAIQTFALAAHRDPANRALAWRVFAVAHGMRRRDGAFVFQRRRWWTNATPHVRWVAAPMLLALTHLLALGSDDS